MMHLVSLIEDAKEDGRHSDARALARIAHVVMGETDLKLLDTELQAAYGDGMFDEWLSGAGSGLDTKMLNRAGLDSRLTRGKVTTRERKGALKSDVSPLLKSDDQPSSVQDGNSVLL